MTVHQIDDDDIGLARRMAHALSKRFPDSRYEFLSEAYLALAQSAFSFDPESNVKFQAFASFRIKGALKDEQRRGRPRGYRGVHQHEKPPKVTWIEDSDNSEVEYSLAIDDRTGTQSVDRDDLVGRCLRVLNPKERHVITETYYKGKSQAEVARSIRLSTSEVSRIHKQAIDRIRECLGSLVDDQ